MNILYHDFTTHTHITPQSLTFSYTANGKWFENGWHKNVYQSSRKMTRRGHTVININKFNRKLNTTRYFNGNQCPTSVYPPYNVQIRGIILQQLPHFINSLLITFVFTTISDEIIENKEIHYKFVVCHH